MHRTIMATLAVLALAGCGVRDAAQRATTAPTIAGEAPRPLSGRLAAALPLGKTPKEAPAPAGDGTDAWTQAALEVLDQEGVTLLSTVPADVMQFCPGYATQTRENRAAFWAGLLSAMARQEGAEAAGLASHTAGKGQSGGCAGELLAGGEPLQCAVRTVARHVVRDGSISGHKGGWRGAAREWLPLRSDGSRAKIAGFTRKQSYCR